MNYLNINTIVYAGDYEKTEYLLLGELKELKKNFQKNMLYPGLSLLISLHKSLRDLNEERVKEILLEDTEEGHIFMNAILAMSKKHIEKVMKLADWVLPIVKDILEEGKILYDFVKSNLEIEDLGQTSRTVENGCILMIGGRQQTLDTPGHKDIKADTKNSAFVLVTDLDFPIKETIIPVAKRKLISFFG